MVPYKSIWAANKDGDELEDCKSNQTCNPDRLCLRGSNQIAETQYCNGTPYALAGIAVGGLVFIFLGRWLRKRYGKMTPEYTLLLQDDVEGGVSTKSFR